MHPVVFQYTPWNVAPSSTSSMGLIVDIRGIFHPTFLSFVGRYTSDAITLGSCSAQNAPFNNSLGLSASFDRLKSLKQRFVRSFLGLRIMEVFSMDFTIRAVRTTNPDWALPCWRRVVLASNTSFFQESLLHDVLSFSREHGLFVQFSDWHWSTFAPWDAPLKAQEISLANILRDYPNLAIVTYANNEPGGASATRLRNWQQALASFSAWSDYGLSDQGWLCDNNCSKPACPCPPSAIVAWAVSAVNQSEYIQFEPAWEHFDLPAGTFEDSSFAGKTGHPLPVFAALVRALGVASVSGI